jgi:hypothetical protein
MGEIDPADLSDFPRAERVFAVISWGCAATTWIARALNAHPDIYATHRMTSVSRLTGVKLEAAEYLDLLAMESFAYVAVGDVHSISSTDVPALNEMFGDRFRAAVVVREPYRRYRSTRAMQRKLAHTGFWDHEHLHEPARAAGLDIADDDTDAWFAVGAANLLNMVTAEDPGCPIYRSEDLVSDPATLVRFVRHLSGGRVHPTAEWARTEVRREPVHSHARAGDELTARDHEIIQRIVRPEAWAAYRRLGYDTVPRLRLGHDDAASAPRGSGASSGSARVGSGAFPSSSWQRRGWPPRRRR